MENGEIVFFFNKKFEYFGEELIGCGVIVCCDFRKGVYCYFVFGLICFLSFGKFEFGLFVWFVMNVCEFFSLLIIVF